jgi:hypothetical protein
MVAEESLRSKEQKTTPTPLGLGSKEAKKKKQNQHRNPATTNDKTADQRSRGTCASA